MYYYELHMHTQETSRCGKSSAYEMVKAYKDLGFSGVCITDHFVNGYSYAALPRTWDEKIDAFMKGYNAAREAGEQLGLDVFFGWEYTYQGNNAEDYITLGLTEENLRRDLIDCDQWDLQRYIDTVHRLGGIIIRAHPYRVADYIPTAPIEKPGLNIDAIEVYNGGNPGTDFDDQALAFARKENKPQVAGSDAHHVSTAGIGYIGLDEKANTYEDLCIAIQKGKTHVFRNPKVEP